MHSLKTVKVCRKIRQSPVKNHQQLIAKKLQLHGLRNSEWKNRISYD